jgi:hypothetical protein
MQQRSGALPKPFRAALLTFATTLLPALGCAANPSEAQAANRPDRFTLRVGESASIEGASLEVGFLEVASDSRCPKGERCVREGDATVRIWVQRGAGAKEKRDLHTSGKAPDSADDSGYEVRLLRLAPEPVSGRTIEQRDYVATLQVSRE